MSKPLRIALILVVVVCFGVALSYPVLYKAQQEENLSTMEELAKMREDVLSMEESSEPGVENTSSGRDESTPSTGNKKNESSVPSAESSAAGADAETKTEEPKELTIEDLIIDYVPGMKWRQVEIPEYEELAAPVSLNTRTALEDRFAREDPLPYSMKEKVTLDPDRILPELKAIYEKNKDLVGWLRIPGTVINYPVVQTRNSEYYLDHDFYGKENNNGQIILDTRCDPYTPSYNLVISGHHMRSGDMFGNLPMYADEEYWSEHKFAEFDNLMERKQYVIMAAFYSADYDEHEEGFRYNKDVQYRIDAEQWLEEIRENQIYETGIDAEFGDEFITLTTCERSRRQDGRFVLILRKIREGEKLK